MGPPPMPEDLSDLIAEIDVLRLQLGYQRWSHIKHMCDAPYPQCADREDLEALLERLCEVWVNDRG